ncbi:MAG TPA: TolC family protein [Gemmatimonadales bacterium]|nr:TolC family protein [Gemmatimonadales bacterium]
MKAIVILFLLSLAGRVAAQTAPASRDTVARRLSLGQALELAEQRSEAVGLARSDVARNEGLRRQARSGYFPQLSGTASYQRTLRSQFSAFASDTARADTTTSSTRCARFTPNPTLPIEQRLDSLESAVSCASRFDPFAAFSTLPFGRENTYRFGLSASQTLFSGGRVGGQVASAEAGVRGAEFGLTAARAQALLDVTQAYYDAALDDHLVRIAEATLEQADTTLSQTQLARQVGNQSEFELLRAKVTRDNQRPIVIQRRADREVAYDRLRQLLDLPTGQPLTLTTELVDTGLVQAGPLTAMLTAIRDTTIDGRVPVRQAAEAVRAQEGALRTARASRMPQLVLSSDFADIGFPSNGSPFGTDYLADWTVSVALSVPLFTGGRIKGQVESATADVESARLRLQQTRERSDLDARTAEVQLASAVAAWEASAGTEEQAQRAYEIAEVRYREGVSTQTELNDQRIQLATAQVTRARAARDLQVARIRLALQPLLPLSGQAATTAVSSTTTTTVAPPSSATPPPATGAPSFGVPTSGTVTTQTGTVSP